MDVESTFPPAPPPSFSNRFKCQKGRIFDATSACQSACRSSEDILSAAGALTTSKTHTLFYIFSLSQYHYIHAILFFFLSFFLNLLYLTFYFLDCKFTLHRSIFTFCYSCSFLSVARRAFPAALPASPIPPSRITFSTVLGLYLDK